MYYINDLGGLKIEMKSSILNKYLNEDDYSQKLIYRQEEIDIVLKNYIKSEWSKKQKSEKIANHPIIKIAKLYNLRMRIKLEPTSEPIVLPTPVFENVLSKAKQTVSQWNGKIYFVYLPDWNRYSLDMEHPNRNFVIKTVQKLNIPIIDIHTEVFEPHSDPLSLFPFRSYNHYNAEGYKLVAEAIEKRLVLDGYIQ